MFDTKIKLSDILPPSKVTGVEPSNPRYVDTVTIDFTGIDDPIGPEGIIPDHIELSVVRYDDLLFAAPSSAYKLYDAVRKELFDLPLRIDETVFDSYAEMSAFIVAEQQKLIEDEQERIRLERAEVPPKKVIPPMMAGGEYPGNKLDIIRAFLDKQEGHPARILRSDYMWDTIEEWELGDWQDLYDEVDIIGHNDYGPYVLAMITWVGVHNFIPPAAPIVKGIKKHEPLVFKDTLDGIKAAHEFLGREWKGKKGWCLNDWYAFAKSLNEGIAAFDGEEIRKEVTEYAVLLNGQLALLNDDIYHPDNSIAACAADGVARPDTGKGDGPVFTLDTDYELEEIF
jgi:hypothetical protein